MVLAVIFNCIFFDFDPVKSFPLRQAGMAVTSQLGKLIEANVKSVTGFGLGGVFAAKPKKDDPLAAYGINLIKGLSKAGLSAYDIAWSQILPTAGASVPNIAELVRSPQVQHIAILQLIFCHQFAQAVDFFLSPSGASCIPELYLTANLPPSAETDSLLLGYCMEGIRLTGTFGSYREAAIDDVIEEDDGRKIPVRGNDKIFVSFVSLTT
jgi:hypothetical protein